MFVSLLDLSTYIWNILLFYILKSYQYYVYTTQILR